jgi:hypothetical protein
MKMPYAETCQVCRGGGYALAGGFWGGAAQVYYLFLPLILR